MKSTHITMVLDRSGSMQEIRADAEGGVNAFIAEQKTLDGPCSLSLYEFDDQIDRIYHGPISEFGTYTLVPRGWTSLLDAIGRAMNETGDYLRKLPESERPEVVVFVVMTDGYENTSREFNISKIKEMIRHQESKYSWEITFLGAGLDVTNQAYSFGFDPNKVTTFSAGVGASAAGAYHSHSISVGHLRSFGATSYAHTIDDNGVAAP